MKGIFLAAVAALRIAAISDNFDGRVGVTAIDLDTGQRIDYRQTQAFPMASVCKVPIGIAFLRRVDRGEVSLDTKVTLGPDDFHAGVSPIADRGNGQPVTLTLRELVTLMLRDSDNSAVDYVLAHYAPPKEVMQVLRELRVKGGIDVSRPEGMIIGEIMDEGDMIETRAHYAARQKSISTAEATAGLRKFWNDPRDTATPAAMAELFAKIQRHQVGLSAASEALMLQALRETAAGPDRIRAGLPPGAALAHKTGTMPGTLNDAGIITSPDGKHHIAIAVFTKWSRGTEADRAKVVAAVARAVVGELVR